MRGGCGAPVGRRGARRGGRGGRTGGPRLLLDPLDPNRLLTFVIRPLHSHRLQTRLFQSPDGGDRWLPLELELSPDEQGAALAVDLADPRGVLLFTNRGALPMQWPPRSAADFDSGDIAVLQGDPTTLPLQCARSVRDGAPAGSGGPGFFLRPVANPREPLWDDRSDREPGLPH